MTPSVSHMRKSIIKYRMAAVRAVADSPAPVLACELGAGIQAAPLGKACISAIAK